MFNRTTAILAVAAIGLSATFAFAQGIIVDQRPDIALTGTYVVDAVAVDATVRDQVASVMVSQTFRNPGNGTIEAEYFFPLPAEGAVQNFTLMVDGKELPGKLLDKDEARRIYESIVRQKQDPALLEYVGRGLYKTSVFPIPAGAKRTLTMKYTLVCPKDRDVVKFAYPYGTYKITGKPVKNLTLRVVIEAGGPIKNIYSPTHNIGTSRPSEKQAVVSFEQHDVVPASDFVLYYSVKGGEVGATLLTFKPSEADDGYFLLLASPGFTKPDAKPTPKTVVFVIDKSGSMSGKKIAQARDAAKFVINNLNEGDTFNIITYDDQVQSFKPELQTYSETTRAEALGFVGNIRDGGSTNINDALTTALKMLKDPKRPSYVLFLTDGLPTAGEQDELKIAQNAKAANEVGARLINFGVGFDVNARLLDRLSGGNGGVSEYVKPNEDLEGAVARFQGRLTSPVLAGIEVKLAGTDINRTYPRRVPDLFEGGQLVWVGRYTKPGKTTVEVAGQIAGKAKTFHFDGTLADPNAGSAYAFVEKLWAVRRVGEIIDELDLKGRNEELVQELVALSTKHGILTPYTSFLAEEDVRLDAVASNVQRAGREAEALEEVSDAAGVAQRSYKNEAKSADQAPMARPTTISVTGERRQVETVLNVGNKTFYRRGNRWIDSTIKEDQLAGARQVKQFSDEYFEIVRNNRAELNQYMTFKESVAVDLDGQLVEIVVE